MLVLHGRPITTADVAALYPCPFYVDTAGSWEGMFPPVGEGDWLVLVELDGEPEPVIVSRRYVSATGPDDAGRLAVDAFGEWSNVGWDDDADARDPDRIAVMWARPIVPRLRLVRT